MKHHFRSATALSQYQTVTRQIIESSFGGDAAKPQKFQRFLARWARVHQNHIPRSGSCYAGSNTPDDTMASATARQHGLALQGGLRSGWGGPDYSP